jgi:energy-coupling factor transporter transmembrane protein EcfT
MLLILMVLGILFGLKVKESGYSLPMYFIVFWVLVFFLYAFKFIFTPYRIDVLFNDKARFVGTFTKDKTIPLEHINVIEAHRMSLKIVARNSKVSCINNIENFDRFIYTVKEKNPYLILKGL